MSGQKIQDMKNSVINTMGSIRNMNANIDAKLFTQTNMKGIIFLSMSIIFIIVGLIYYLLKTTSLSREMSYVNSLYPELNGLIKSVDNAPMFNYKGNDPEDNKYDYTLRDFYIRTAYNCCSPGNYKNDYVNLDVLKTLLKQGVRGLDFEIYSINDQPIVSTSTSDSYYVKETYNYIYFADVMELIKNYAFSTSSAPNSRDPIILHLRIRSNNLEMYKNFATLLKQYDSILLGKEYDSEYNGKNFGTVPLKNLLGKVSIILEKINTTYLECPEFYKFINMTSKSVFMKAIDYNSIASGTEQVNDLIEFNKQNMTICMPDSGENPVNPYFYALTNTGCQFIAMRYSMMDENLVLNNDFFNNIGYSFILKPLKLRYIPVIIPLPPQQNPELSFATRTVESDFYKFDI
jgi:hypothetical protein